MPGVVKRAFGWAAGVPSSLRPGLAAPVGETAGGVFRHALPPDIAVGVMATLVKIELARRAMALGLVSAPVPGATPKKPASGLIA
jgi:hypothetical protein